jgi:hypothetical protein
MPRRPAVLLTSPRSISTSSFFRTFCTLLQKSKAHPLPLQSLPASLQKLRVCRHTRFLISREESFNSSTLNLELAFNSFRINTYKSVSKQRTLTPFRINTYAKSRGANTANHRSDDLSPGRSSPAIFTSLPLYLITSSPARPSVQFRFGTPVLRSYFPPQSLATHLSPGIQCPRLYRSSCHRRRVRWVSFRAVGNS